MSVYSRVVEAFDSIDPGIKYYFMHKLQTLVIRTAEPSCVISDGSIVSKFKKTSPSSLISRSFLTSRSQRSNLSELFRDQKRLLSGGISDELDEANLIENEYKMLEEMQEHKQEAIKSSLTTQQESIAKRLQKRKEKTRRRSLDKTPESDAVPVIKK